MSKFIKLIMDNKEWLFSGVGMFVVGAIIKLFKKKKNNGNNFIQTGNIKAGRDVKIKNGGK